MKQWYRSRGRWANTGIVALAALSICGCLSAANQPSEPKDAAPTEVVQASATMASPVPSTATPVPTSPMLVPVAATPRAPTATPTRASAATPLRPAAPMPALSSTPQLTAAPTLVVKGTPTLARSRSDTPTVEAAEELALVTRVIDGDTIEVELGGQRCLLRYIGIDSPEPAGAEGDTKRLANEATEANRQLVEGKVVRVEKDVSNTDRYGRLLRYVYLADGTFVNAQLLRLGYAIVSTYPPDVKYQDAFLKIQGEARESGLGLWSALPTPVTLPQGAVIAIVKVNNSGKVEFVDIANRGNVAVDMSGWHLYGSRDYTDGRDDYYFPKGFVLEAGQSVRLHSGDKGTDMLGNDVHWTTHTVWNNEGETVLLKDSSGSLVAEYSYGKP